MLGSDNSFSGSPYSAARITYTGSSGNDIFFMDGLASGSPTAAFFITNPANAYGKVGIGYFSNIYSTNIDAGLTVQSKTSASTDYAFDVFNSSNTKMFTVRSDGNVGVGTSSPTSALHVVGPAGTVSTPNAATALTVVGGAGYASGNGNGGGISLSGGASTGTGTGGNVTISAGSGSGSPSFGPRGSVTINGGDNGSDVNGSVTIRGGYYGTSTAPQLVLQGSGSTATGNITLSTPNGTGTAGITGSISISTGNSSMGYAAGNLNLTAGNGSNAAAGGAVNITAGNGGASNINGSNVVLSPGAGGGTGTYGNVILASAGGKVGIGTSSPSGTLDVTGTAGLIYRRSGASSSISMTDYGGSQPLIALSGADSSVPTNIASAGPLRIYSGSTNLGSASAKLAFSADTAGQVGIGTSSPDQLFSVNGDASKVGGGSWQTFSDARLKTVNGDFTRGLEDILKLQPISYHYNDRNPAGIPNNGDHIGFVAQDVEKVIPEAISKSKKGYLMVNNDPIIWTMFNAIKELYYKIVAQDSSVQEVQKENEALKSKVQDLEQQNKAIKSYLCEKDPQASLCQ